MRRAARLASVLSVAGWLLLLTAGSAQAQTTAPLLDCPSSLDGMPRDPYDVTYAWSEGGGGWTSKCYYTETVDGAIPQERSATAYAMWGDDSWSGDPFLCQGDENPVPDDLSMTYSTTNRAYSDYGIDTRGGPVDEAAVKELADRMRLLAEQRGSPCSESGQGAGQSGSVPSVIATPTVVPSGGGTTSDPGQGNGAGVGMLAGGAVLSVLAGVGSVLAGRAGRAGSAGASPAAMDVLYGDEDSVGILTNGEQLEAVRGPGGELIGYRPLGDLASFIRNRPQWQPEFGTPLATPNGRATHLGGVAFQADADGLIQSITVTVREVPAAALVAGAQTTAPTPSSAPSPEPFEEAPIRGDGILQAVLEPDLDYFRSELASHPPTPADLPVHNAQPPSSPFERQLLRPGNKVIGMKEVEQLGPDLFDERGALARGPYAGSRPSFEVEGNHLTVKLPAPPGSPMPSIEASARLSARDGRLEIRDVRVPPEVKLGAQLFGQPDPAELVKRFLEAFNQRVDAAGSRVAGVGSESGDLLLKLDPR